jgi:2-keto-4-pentenoate hydratase/2-oxohepta-3-ene-1,7-dioic acid hydratase in catechol pathway
VDEGEGFEVRQHASSARMILDPHALLVRLAEWVGEEGLRSPMPLRWRGEIRHYPLARSAEAPHLPAGSLVLTGTPEGVAIQVPEALALAGRGLLALRGPIEQFRHEQLARVASGQPGGYLVPGDRVRARIDGLGAQIVRIVPPGTPIPDPCAAP